MRQGARSRLKALKRVATRQRGSRLPVEEESREASEAYPSVEARTGDHGVAKVFEPERGAIGRTRSTQEQELPDRLKNVE